MRAHFMAGQCNRRAFLLTTAGLLSSRLSQAQLAVTANGSGFSTHQIRG